MSTEPTRHARLVRAVFAGSLCNYLTYDTALESARRMTFGAVRLAKSSGCGICSRSLDRFLGRRGREYDTSCWGREVASHASQIVSRATVAPSDPCWPVGSERAILAAPQERRERAAIPANCVSNVVMERIAVEPLANAIRPQPRLATSGLVPHAAGAGAPTPTRSRSSRHATPPQATGRSRPFHKVEVFWITRSPLTKEMPCTT